MSDYDRRENMTDKASAALRAMREHLGNKARGMRVWTGNDGRARLYVGTSAEYVEWTTDGHVRTSKTNIAWGHVVRDVVEGL